LIVAAVALSLLVAPAEVAAAPRVPVEHAGLDQGAPAYYDSGQARTPYMGWNSYFGVGAASEENVTSVANFLVGSGLAKAGYDIVWIDGGWHRAWTPPSRSRSSVPPFRRLAGR
jgi:alpha-galactosidase